MSRSLLLDTISWDLCVDANHNIAVCSEPYADAQDAACQMRLFKGELWYDTTQGVPYWTQLLGHWPPLSLLKADLTFAALEATNVVSAAPYITSWSHRSIGGVVQVTNNQGVTATTAWGASPGVSSL